MPLVSAALGKEDAAASVGAAVAELRGVSRAFGDLLAAEDLDLETAPGECLSFLGPSGCGKTTALRMLAGFETPTAGEVLIDGVVVNDPEPSERPLEAAHHPFMAVVEDRRERQGRPRLVPPWPQQPADLDREDEAVARPAAQRLAHAVLGEAGTVEGCDVELADPALERRVDQCRRLAGIGSLVQKRQRRAAEAEDAELEAGPRVVASRQAQRRFIRWGQAVVQPPSIKGRIRDDIVKGVFDPEARLTIDRLAGRYGSSHMPIREALREPAGEGLVRFEPHRGARTLPIDRSFIDNLLIMRAEVERLLARRDDSAAVDANGRFHREIKRIADNLEAGAIVDRHWLPLGRLWAHYGYAADRFAGVISDHRGLLQAFAEGASDDAAALMKAHVIEAKYQRLARHEACHTTRAISA